MNNRELLSYLLSEYHQASRLAKIRYAKPIIELKNYLSNQAINYYDPSILEKILSVYLPVLQQWEVNQKPSGSLRILPKLIIKLLSIYPGNNKKINENAITLFDLKNLIAGDINSIFKNQGIYHTLEILPLELLRPFNQYKPIDNLIHTILLLKQKLENKFSEYNHTLESIQKDHIWGLCTLYSNNLLTVKNQNKLFQLTDDIPFSHPNISEYRTHYKQFVTQAIQIYILLEATKKYSDNDGNLYSIGRLHYIIKDKNKYDILYTENTINNNIRNILISKNWSWQIIYITVLLTRFNNLLLTNSQDYILTNLTTLLNTKQNYLSAIILTINNTYPYFLYQNPALITDMFNPETEKYFIMRQKVIYEAYLMQSENKPITTEKKEILAKLLSYNNQTISKSIIDQPITPEKIANHFTNKQSASPRLSSTRYSLYRKLHNHQQASPQHIENLTQEDIRL